MHVYRYVYARIDVFAYLFKYIYTHIYHTCVNEPDELARASAYTQGKGWDYKAPTVAVKVELRRSCLQAAIHAFRPHRVLRVSAQVLGSGHRYGVSW